MIKRLFFFLLLATGLLNAQVSVPGWPVTGGGGGGGGTGIPIGNNVTNAANFGIKSDYVAFDASVTSGQQIVTCTSNCHFLTTAAVGNMMQGGNFASGQILATGTITSVDSDTQIHVSTTASATASGTMQFAWGQDNTTALSNAYTASLQACSFLYIPAGLYFTTTAQFISTSTACNFPSTFNRAGVFGDVGWANTTIVPTYNFNFATCTGSAGHTCFFGVHYGSYDYMAFDGMYGGSTNSTLNLTENNGGYFYRVRVNNWCAGCTNAVGMVFSNINPITTEGSVVSSGGLANCASAATAAIAILNPCFIQPGGGGTAAASSRGMYVTSGQLQSFSNGYGGGLESVRVDAGAVLEEDNDIGVPGGGSGNAITNGIHIMRQCKWTTFGNRINSGGVLYASNTDWTGLSGYLNIQSGGKFVDQGGNIAGTAPTNSGVYSGGPAANVVITSAKLVLSATWGSTAAWSALSGFNNVIGTITASGTGQGANPTITYTFPVPYLLIPQTCNASIVKSSDAAVTLANNFLAASALSATGVTFTWSGTPTAAATYVVQIQCFN